MIQITIDGASAEEIQNEMRQLLNGEGRSTGVTAGGIGTSGSVGETATEAAASAAKRPSGRTRAAAADKAAAATGNTGQGISSGEERVDPEADKQDAKDEAADTKAAAPEPVKLSHDSVRTMLGGYVQAYGMAAAQEDGTKIIEVPKISDLKDEQAVLAKAVVAVATAIEKNPYNREIAGDGITKEKLAELKPLVVAAKAVA